MAEQFALCVKSELANLAQIAEFVTEQAQSVGMDDDQVFAIQMAVDEACTNSMEHAYNGHDDGEVTVCCYGENDDFVVKITDLGDQFDPSAVPEPDISQPLEERSVGGLGIFLMRRLMDSVEFHTDPDNGNEVIMRKHRKPVTA
jgi:anti-sigma regulatory factor (Ser/Thr protein kinase)